MKKLLYSFLIFCSINAYAEGSDVIYSYSSVEAHRVFAERFILPEIKSIPDVIDREEKVTSCITEYIENQSKSYAKIVQNNLYDLIHNFDNIALRIQGKKPTKDDTPYEEKIEALAKLHCEAYYAINALK